METRQEIFKYLKTQPWKDGIIVEEWVKLIYPTYTSKRRTDWLNKRGRKWAERLTGLRSATFSLTTTLTWHDTLTLTQQAGYQKLEWQLAISDLIIWQHEEKERLMQEKLEESKQRELAMDSLLEDLQTYHKHTTQVLSPEQAKLLWGVWKGVFTIYGYNAIPLSKAIKVRKLLEHLQNKTDDELKKCASNTYGSLLNKFKKVVG